MTVQSCFLSSQAVASLMIDRHIGGKFLLTMGRSDDSLSHNYVFYLIKILKVTVKQKKSQKPTFIDMFCGCGGITAGLQDA